MPAGPHNEHDDPEPSTITDRRIALAERVARGDVPSVEQAETDLGLGRDVDFGAALIKRSRNR
jgi:hypothetical protein